MAPELAINISLDEAYSTLANYIESGSMDWYIFYELLGDAAAGANIDIWETSLNEKIANYNGGTMDLQGELTEEQRKIILGEYLSRGLISQSQYDGLFRIKIFDAVGMAEEIKYTLKKNISDGTIKQIHNKPSTSGGGPGGTAHDIYLGVYNSKILNLASTTVDDFFSFAPEIGDYTFERSDLTYSPSNLDYGGRRGTSICRITAKRNCSLEIDYEYAFPTFSYKFYIYDERGNKYVDSSGNLYDLDTITVPLMLNDNLYLKCEVDEVDNTDGPQPLVEVTLNSITTDQSVARKVKNIYVGVGGVARKVKIAYIGVNGVARLCYATQLIEHSMATDLAAARSKLAGASVGSYALFAGEHDYASVTTSVDCYSTPLTRSSPSGLSNYAENLASTSVGNYALFAGGRANYPLGNLDAYKVNRDNAAAVPEPDKEVRPEEGEIVHQ